METKIKNTTIVKLPEQEISVEKYEYFLNEIAEQHKSEYINGEIIIHSPAKKKHIDVNLNLVSIIRAYVVKFDLGFVGQEKTLIKMNDSTNSYEPDICFFRKERTVEFDANTGVFPPPDWAIEIISKSSETRDRNIKFLDYAKNGVEEYWLINTEEEKIEQYYSTDKNIYILIREYCNDDIISSITLPKLTIPLEAIFDATETNNFHFGKYEKAIKEKEEIIEKDKELLKEKEELLKEKEEIIEKDKELLKEKEEIIEKDKELLKEKEEIIEKDKELLKEKEEIIEKDKELLKEKDDKLKEKDDKLKEKEKLISELLKKINSK